MKTAYCKRRTIQSLHSYFNSCIMSLDDCYKTCSAEKLEAWAHCVERCEELDGWGLKVVSYNKHVFTAGFLYNNGESVCFYYICRTWEYSIKAW